MPAMPAIHPMPLMTSRLRTSLACGVFACSSFATLSCRSAEPNAPETQTAAGCALPKAAERARTDHAALSVTGAPLTVCSRAPRTGVYRDGFCETGPDDRGVHVVCAEVDERFLSFTASSGNDLTTPAAGFPGLHPGDRWCLCASRWVEAEAAGVAPKVDLAATEEAALRYTARETLAAHALPSAAIAATPPTGAVKAR